MMSETVLKIDGMTCMHCGEPGVTGAQVDLIKKQATAVAGFKVVGRD